jgi:SAM-dependent methyltransferase
MNSQSNKQKEHYEFIHDNYEHHYFDKSSMAYRSRFVYDELFRDLDLNNKLVADLASGSGYNSLAILDRFPSCSPIGFDISQKACDSYRKIVKRDAYLIDLTAGIDPGMRVDVAMIFGGLHHCISNLSATFRTIAHIIKPNGLLLMFEPNSRYFLEGVRKLWYSTDKYFEYDTEAALDHDKISAIGAHNFSPKYCRYMGGPAYFLIYNSLVFRIPQRFKKHIAPPLFILESGYNKLPGRFWYPYFIARWQRNHNII